MVSALIAEDEPLLAAALSAELAVAWPALQVVATVGDGVSAVAQALAMQPDVLFFDIQMPGLTGLEAAADLLDAWPLGADCKPFPVLVFVTAYDQYAVAAFEAEAIDYLLKPVQATRLLKTVQKVQKVQGMLSAQQNGGKSAINNIAISDMRLEQTVAQLRALMLPAVLPSASTTASHAASATASSAAPLTMIVATLSGSQGNTLQMVPIADVLYFEAADKYIRVLTAHAEFLIRTPLKDLLPQLNNQTFWQIHRGTAVRASAINTVQRDARGKLTISMHGSQDKLAVSRIYSNLFKAF